MNRATENTDSGRWRSRAEVRLAKERFLLRNIRTDVVRMVLIVRRGFDVRRRVVCKDAPGMHPWSIRLT